MLKKKIAFIGPGVMAEAMIAGLLRKKLAKPENMTASGPREERVKELGKKYGIKFFYWATIIFFLRSGKINPQKQLQLSQPVSNKPTNIS